MPTNEDTAAQEIEEQRRVNRNLQRRTRYAQMSPERKQIFLSQLRVKRAESKKQRLSYHSINTLSSMKTAAQPERQTTLTIADPPLSFERGSTSAVYNITNYPTPTTAADNAKTIPITSDEEDNMPTCLSVFEIGSTSGIHNTTNFSALEATANSDHLPRGKTEYFTTIFRVISVSFCRCMTKRSFTRVVGDTYNQISAHRRGVVATATYEKTRTIFRVLNRGVEAGGKPGDFQVLCSSTCRNKV